MSSEQTGTAATAEKPLRELPAALKGRAKIVYSENPEVDGVMVQRWSIEKSQLIIPEIFAIWRQLPEQTKRKAYALGGKKAETDDEKMAEVEAMIEIAMTAVEHCLDKTRYIIKLSAIEADKEKIPLMDADELLDLAEAVLEVNPNLIPKLKKKGPKLLARFGPLMGAKPKTTP